MRGNKFADEEDIIILTDEEDIKELIKEVEENLENAETLVEF